MNIFRLFLLLSQLNIIEIGGSVTDQQVDTRLQILKTTDDQDDLQSAWWSSGWEQG